MEINKLRKLCKEITLNLKAMNNIIKFFILISILAVLILLLLKNFPESMNNETNQASLISTIVLLSFFIFRIANSNVALGTFLKQILSWVLIIFIVLAGYSYKFELKQFSNRILANLIPGYGQEYGHDSMIFYANDLGHFTIKASLNDKIAVNFLLDTGASTVTLTTKDAKTLGIDTDSLVYNIPFITANGTTWGAKITIDKIQIGTIVAYDVPANVSKANEDISLLGMSFLKRLSSFQIQDHKLILTK